MKKIFFLILTLGVSILGFSQQQTIKLNSEEYRQAKLNGTISNYIIEMPSYEEIQNNSLLIDTKIPDGKGANKGKGEIPPKAIGCLEYSVPVGYTPTGIVLDDASTALIPLSFPFCFYGDTVTAIYINANGNITFNAPLISYSSTAFPSTINQILAPFWADVDVQGGGTISYLMTASSITINWYDVGYFPAQGDKRNNFSLVMTDGNDPSIIGGNVAFLYGDMQWTTGSASSGVGGFGGTPATAGANKGDGVNYFLIARFDHPGSDFDGALGNNDGISWLDDRSFYFDFCAAAGTQNVAPVAVGINECDTVKICALGDTADFPVIFLSPEANQSTSIAVSSATLTTLQVINNTPGNTATALIRAVGTLPMVGTHIVTVTATDNFIPSASTTINFVLIIDTTGVANFNPVLSPVSACDSLEVLVLNGPYDGYVWDNFLLDSSQTIYSSLQDYGVTVEQDGCYKRVTADFYVPQSSNFNLVGNNVVCPNTNGNLFQILDSLNQGSVSWGLANPALDSLWSNVLNVGTYTVTVSDPQAFCIKDTTFTVTGITPIVLQADDVTCDDQYVFTLNTGGSGSGGWSVLQPSPIPTFASNSNINTTVTFPTFGIYNLIYSDNNCAYQDTVQIAYAPPPNIVFNSVDFFVCPGETEAISLPDSALYANVSWGLPNPTLDTLFSADLSVGTYTVTVTNIAGCTDDTTFTIATQQKILLNQQNTLCGDSAELFNNFGVPGGTWSSVAGPGTVTFYPPTQLNTTCEFSQPGTYILMYSEPVCSDFDTMLVKVTFYPYVQVADIVGCKDVPEEAPSFDTWGNITSYQWSNGQTGPTATLTEGGYYYVTASNSCGSHTWSFLFDARPCDIEMPNVFSPNGDPVNGIYGPIVGQNESFPTFKCQIFNRWGNLMYEFTDMNKGWDGESQNGTKADDGVYFYNLIAVDVTGKELSKQGFFHLLRN